MYNTHTHTHAHTHTHTHKHTHTHNMLSSLCHPHHTPDNINMFTIPEDNQYHTATRKHKLSTQQPGYDVTKNRLSHE